VSIHPRKGKHGTRRKPDRAGIVATMTDDVTRARGRIFDRVPEASANADYPVAEAFTQLRAGSSQQRERVWWTPPAVPLDQGDDGACVGFAWTHELLTTPVRVDLSAVKLPPRNWPSDPAGFAFRSYYAMQRNDQWDGGDYPGAVDTYVGTSVVAGARVMRRLGFLPEYRWAESPDDVRRSLLTFGPCVAGFSWRESMFEPESDRLEVAGDVVGGHCVLLNGYDPDRGYAITNSWGPGWGSNGTAWVSAAGLLRLFSDRGEVAVPIRRSYGPRKG